MGSSITGVLKKKRTPSQKKKKTQLRMLETNANFCSWKRLGLAVDVPHETSTSCRTSTNYRCWLIAPGLVAVSYHIDIGHGWLSRLNPHQPLFTINHNHELQT